GVGGAGFGALLGPGCGGSAGGVGTRATFTAVGGLIGVVLVAALRGRGAPAQPQSLRALGPALRERRLTSGVWLVTLPALLFGVFAVLVAFRLDDAGWGSVGIGAVFLVA